MFSQLGPLFKTMLRQAEKPDARMEIRRDEKRENGRGFDEPQEESAGPNLWEDSASVSVAALRSFLGEFLKSRGKGESVTAAPPHPDPFNAPYTPPPLMPATSIAARAMKAYGAHTPPPVPPPEPPPPQPEPAPANSLSDLLQVDEIRTIHALIAGLNELEKKGVQTLTIEKAETFLQSLVHAIEAERAKL